MPRSARKSRSVAVRAPRAAAPEAGLVYVTRQVHFNAAHRLYNPAFGDRWNEKQFGACTNPRWHGHNYVLEVTVRGRPDPATGYTLDLIELKRILVETVIEPCDHRNLNEDVDFLRGIIPSTENLVIAFWQRIAPRLKPGQLHRVRLFETPRNFAEYFGPDGLSD
jgi:6-pyruvoyltetrahydropterin/6-carboxytetrahydropterin synthase